MLEDKLKFFGELNAGKECLIRAHKQIVDLWNLGSIRLLSDDIGDISKTEREIRGLLKQIGAFKELFGGIANNKVEPKKDERND